MSLLRHRRASRTRTLRYSRLFKTHAAESDSLVDALSAPGDEKHSLRDSFVLNSLWTADEKDKFFTALARCGKGNLPEVARRVATKSLTEVTAFVGLLDEETVKLKQGNKNRYGMYHLSKMPAAVEVDQQWLAFEERMAAKIGNVAGRRGMACVAEGDGDSVLNVENANEVAQW